MYYICVLDDVEVFEKLVCVCVWILFRLLGGGNQFLAHRESTTTRIADSHGSPFYKHTYESTHLILDMG